MAPNEPLSMVNQVYSNTLLLATISDLDTPHNLGPVISSATRATRSRLTIIIFSRLFNAVNHPISRIDHWNDIQSLLTFLYVQATKTAQDIGNILLDVDVLLLGLDEHVPDHIADGVEVVFRVQGDVIPVPLPSSVSTRRISWLIPSENDSPPIPSSPVTPQIQHHIPTIHSPNPSTADATPADSQPPSTLPVVALGGTFDHLHAGHKILLSMAAFITSRKLIVGITSDALLRNKSHPHLIQPFSVRTDHLREFLTRFKPALELQLAPIDDVYGPTGYDPDIQGLVVSRETVKGAEAIASHRATHNLPQLDTFIIDVISPTETSLDHNDMEMLKETKMSSTFIREWIYKHQSQNTNVQP